MRRSSLLGLPGAVRDIRHYRGLLERFYGLYEPLERSILEFAEWESAGLAPAVSGHSFRLLSDLSVLGTDVGRIPRVPPAVMPDLPTFPHALGALYVLEGSALGGKVIMREMDRSVKQQIEGATSFFVGRDPGLGLSWDSFRAALDSFGRANPALCEDVVIGAERVFAALRTWFGPARNVAA
jgi:heme oxygenase (biliverdin-IX-beta and delta-forming)